MLLQSGTKNLFHKQNRKRDPPICCLSFHFLLLLYNASSTQPQEVRGQIKMTFLDLGIFSLLLLYRVSALYVLKTYLWEIKHLTTKHDDDKTMCVFEQYGIMFYVYLLERRLGLACTTNRLNSSTAVRVHTDLFIVVHCLYIKVHILHAFIKVF